MQDDFLTYQEKINKSENILVVYGKEASFAAVSLATSLFLWLKELKKNTFLVSPSEPVVELCNLVGINKVKKSLPKQNLVIKMDYNEDRVAKVLSDLNKDKNELSIVIKPQKGSEPIGKEDLRISYQTGDFDLIFLIEVQTKEELDKLFFSNENLLEQPEKVVAMNSFTSHCPVMSGVTKELGKQTGFVGWWGQMLKNNQVMIEADQASNLLMGLEKETGNFTDVECSAENFELAAWLLRQGGVRHKVDAVMVDNFQAEHHLPKIGLDIPKAKK